MAKKFHQGIDANAQRVQNVGTPSSGTDATNRDYVDQAIEGKAWKKPVRFATTAAGTLATSFAAGQVVDGVTLVLGDRGLIKDQAAGAENGIYVVQSSGAPTRAGDMDSSAEAINNATVLVGEGTVNADKAFNLTNNGTITLGTTALVWALVSPGNVYTAGNGLSLTSGAFAVVPKASGGIVVDGTGVSVDGSVVTQKYSQDIGNGSATALAVTHSFGTKDVGYWVRNKGTDAFEDCDVVATSTTVITFTFATAPASAAFRVTVMG